MLHVATRVWLRAFASSASSALSEEQGRTDPGIPKQEKKLVPKPSPNVLHL